MEANVIAPWNRQGGTREAPGKYTKAQRKHHHGSNTHFGSTMASPLIYLGVAMESPWDHHEITII